MRAMTLELYTDKRDRYRFRVKAGNGEVLARSSKSYSDKDEIINIIARVTLKQHDAEVYKDRAGEYRWRLALDGQSAIMSSEGYKNASYCREISDQVLDAEFING